MNVLTGLSAHRGSNLTQHFPFRASAKSKHLMAAAPAPAALFPPHPQAPCPLSSLWGYLPPARITLFTNLLLPLWNPATTPSGASRTLSWSPQAHTHGPTNGLWRDGLGSRAQG